MYVCVKPSSGFYTSYVMVSFHFMFSEWRWEMIVRFVHIGGIVDHHYLNLLFIKWSCCIESSPQTLVVLDTDCIQTDKCNYHTITPMAALSTGMHAYCCLLYSWCELCGFIREINSGISHVRYHFFPAGTTFKHL